MSNPFDSEGFTADILRHIFGFLKRSEVVDQAAILSRRFLQTVEDFCTVALRQIDSSTTHRVDAGFWSRCLEYVNTRNGHFRNNNNPARRRRPADDDTTTTPVTLSMLLDDLQVPSRVLLHATRFVATKQVEFNFSNIKPLLLPCGNIAVVCLNDDKIHIYDKNLEHLVAEPDHEGRRFATGYPSALLHDANGSHLLLYVRRQRVSEWVIVWKVEKNVQGKIRGIRFLYQSNLIDRGNRDATIESIQDVAVGENGKLYILRRLYRRENAEEIWVYDVATGIHLETVDVQLQDIAGRRPRRHVVVRGDLLLSGTSHLVLLRYVPPHDLSSPGPPFQHSGVGAYIFNIDGNLTQEGYLRCFQDGFTQVKLGRSKQIINNRIFYNVGNGIDRMISVEDSGNLLDHDGLEAAFDFLQGRDVVHWDLASSTSSSAASPRRVFLVSRIDNGDGASVTESLDEYNISTGSVERTLATNNQRRSNASLVAGNHVLVLATECSILTNDIAVYLVCRQGPGSTIIHSFLNCS